MPSDRTRPWSPATAATLAAASVLAPDVTFTQPIGNDFQVNTYTVAEQIHAEVAVAPDGAAMFVWHSLGSAGPDDWDHSIQGRRYDASGNPLGDDFQINSFTPRDQTFPATAPLPGGGFVVVWHSTGRPGVDNEFDTSILGQRYDASGVANGSEFHVNTYRGGVGVPDVAAAEDGSFVVVWQNHYPYFLTPHPDDDRDLVAGQRYDSSGNQLGAEFQVNTYTTHKQGYPSVAMGSAGDFIVAWRSIGSDGPDTTLSIQGQRYDSAGGALGGEFQINTTTTLNQFDPSVAAAADGSFVVVWKSDYAPSIRGQRFDSAGTPSGGEFQVNTDDYGLQETPSVAADAGGSFAVVWRTFQGGEDIHGQLFDGAGDVVDGEFTVNSYTPFRQSYPAVAMNQRGDFVVAWQALASEGTDNDSYSIQGRRHLPIGHLFRDGFESGNTSAWSGMEP